MSTAYVGRFAPTPSGPLHFGSLVTALASYVDAKANDGRWLLRIEDIDPPRCPPGVATHMLKTLENFGLLWDGEVVYQSLQTNHYQHALETLAQQSLTYHCTCSRSQLRGYDVYPRFCLESSFKAPNATQPSAIRLKTPNTVLGFEDVFMPYYQENLGEVVGDFILQRKEKLFAYQLAVVVDDAMQGVTHVIRGADLYHQTPRQKLLQQYLSLPALTYGHVPLICNAQGQKLSKQNLAKAIDPKQARTLLQQALQRLGHCIPKDLIGAPCEVILQWACQHWQRASVPSYEVAPAVYDA